MDFTDIELFGSVVPNDFCLADALDLSFELKGPLY